MGKERTYLCIDMKTFYASVECAERGLNPFETNLVVADISRGNGALCLAVSPQMKAQGVKNRCRLYEIPKHIKYEAALPRMQLYMWDTENNSPEWVSSAFLPSFNLKQMKPSSSSSKIFNMKRLFTESNDVIIKELRDFMAQYKSWIDGLKTQILSLDATRKSSAEANISKCENAWRTISRTITEMEKDAHSDGVVFRAFRLANEAMYLQRERSLIRQKRPVNSEEINWYPFQLAFLLQEMISFIDPEGEERKKVDLLWFPTGGGKTEAYLGIAAFVIFLRRLRSQSDNGVTIIMRYTLRLLTLQQFERASMLIFACEKLRKEKHLGGSEIAIGLWVGGKLTPNKLDVARASINKQQNGGILSGEDENPCQIKVCPWCGAEITPHDYSVDEVNSRMYIRCPNEECDFHHAPNGLPLHIIDQALYGMIKL